MKNVYTFKSWHNGAGGWFLFTVEAADIDEAYDEAYKISHNTLGLEPEVELHKATCPQEWEVIVVVPGNKPITYTKQHFSEDDVMVDAELRLFEHRIDYDRIYITHIREVR